MITAVLPVVFTSSFSMKTPNQTFEGCMYMYICTRLTVGKEVCRSFGRRKHVARHRNHRLVLSLRSRYRQKTKNRLSPKTYRYIWFYRLRRSRYRQKTKTRVSPKTYRYIWFYRLRRSRYRQKTKNRLSPKTYRYIWFYRLRRSRYRQKSKNRLPPKNYRHILVLPPPPKS